MCVCCERDVAVWGQVGALLNGEDPEGGWTHVEGNSDTDDPVEATFGYAPCLARVTH